MARDLKKTIEALRRMTEANGCTPSEAASAKEKADKMEASLRAHKKTPVQEADEFLSSVFGTPNPTVEDLMEALKRRTREYYDRLKRERDAAAKDADERAKKKAEGEVPLFKNIGECARWVLVNRPGLTYKDMADRVRAYFPEAKTTAASIAWYAHDMKKPAK